MSNSFAYNDYREEPIPLVVYNEEKRSIFN